MTYEGENEFCVEYDPETDEEVPQHVKSFASLNSILLQNKHNNVFLVRKEALRRTMDYMVDNKVDILFIDAFLKPSQIKNIMKLLEKRKELVDVVVIDRLMLIIQIFQKRAQLPIAKL